MSYYLFRINHRFEDKIRRRASRLPIEIIIPMVTSWRRGKRGTKPIKFSEPAFRTYAIVGSEGEFPLAEVMSLHYSFKPMLVQWGESEPCLARIPSHEIQAIKSNRLFKASSARALVSEVEPDPKFTKGELVRILGGAATGLEGKVILACPKSREAEIEISGWPVKLKADYDLLERAA